MGNRPALGYTSRPRRSGGTVDAADSKSAALKSVWVRVPPSAPGSPALRRGFFLACRFRRSVRKYSRACLEPGSQSDGLKCYESHSSDERRQPQRDQRSSEMNRSHLPREQLRTGTIRRSSGLDSSSISTKQWNVFSNRNVMTALDRVVPPASSSP